MSQLPLFGAFGGLIEPKPQSNSKFTSKQSKTIQSKWKRIASPLVQKVEIQPIALPGIDFSLCSNPDRTCGSGSWVIDPQWLAANLSRGGKGGAA